MTGGARTAALASAAVLIALLSGCSGDGRTELEARDATPGYSSGEAVTEVPIDERGDAVSFAGLLSSGGPASSADWIGRVVVVNFWYAACGPCRAEAPDLVSLRAEFPEDDVVFVGVNVRDQASTAESFSTAFGITYPSILDAETGDVQLAFAGNIAPNAVPSTVVLDRQGRVASRIIGQLDRSILETLISDAVAELP